jgi:uncharacterized protein YciU (UPF0263 family)
MDAGEVTNRFSDNLDPVQSTSSQSQFGNSQPSDPNRHLRPNDVIIGGKGYSKSTKKIIIPVILVILALIIISVSIYLFYKNDLIELEEKNLLAGEEVELDPNKQVSLKLERENALMKLDLDESSSTLGVSFLGSEEQIISLDEEVEFDIDGDGVFDVAIKLIRKQNGRLGFTFRRIMLERDTNRGDLDDTFRTITDDSLTDREKCLALDCNDNQVCGYLSQDDKRNGILSCLYKTCSEYSGTICSLEFFCEGDSPFTDILGDNTLSRGCCVGECLPKQDACALESAFFCSPNKVCESDEFTIENIGGNDFTCCTTECVYPNDNGNNQTPECKDGIDNDGDGFIDYVVEDFVGDPVGLWVPSEAQSCDVVCGEVGGVAVPNEYGDSCMSGAATILEAKKQFAEGVYNLFFGGCFPHDCADFCR